MEAQISVRKPQFPASRSRQILDVKAFPFKFAAFIGVYLAAHVLALGCWKSPPEVRVQQTGEGNFFLRNLSKTATIEVWDSKSMERLWESQIPEYNSLFSKFFLSEDGRSLVHVRTNHIVNAIDDICIAVFGRDGFRDTYRVDEVLDELPRHQGGSSVDPKYTWHNSTMHLSKTGAEQSTVMIVGLKNSGYAWFEIGKHDVVVK